MEEVHGVDVSWLHHPGKNQEQARKHARQPSGTKQVQATATPQPNAQPPSQQNGVQKRAGPPSSITPPTAAEPARDNTNALPSTPTPTSANAKTKEKRPNILSRSSSTAAKNGSETGRRSSWLNNISSKFSSSQSTPAEKSTAQPSPAAKQPTTPPASTNGAPSAMPTHAEEAEDVEPYVPSKPSSGGNSFFSSLTRRLSSTSQTAGSPKVQGTGGMCQRRVLNVDPNRQRCLVPEMDVNRLRKVSFCVDVEIAGVARYRDEEDGPQGEDAAQRKKKDVKMKERAEGEALKRPQAVQEKKDTEGEVKMDGKGSMALDIPNLKSRQSNGSLEDDADGGASPPDGTPDNESSSRKREKKKKFEEERKARRENRRRRAEENGSIPVELRPMDSEDASAGSSHRPAQPSLGSSLDVPAPFGRDGAGFTPPQPVSAPPNRQDRPTTDPVRIYRRCCQLRETPILKRITEQLMNPSCIAPFEAGVVNCLDLTGSRLQFADMVTLGDWLAVVPVKALRLEDADLNDEGLRCVLAGLLAAKRPEPSKRKSTSPKHRERCPPKQYKERSGVIEKLTVKNNPRITRMGWKHISLFLYMCTSLKTIDLSMIQFPETLPATPHVNQVKAPQHAPCGNGTDTDAANILYKCLSERLGGSKLEELIMSECALTSTQVRKVVDGAIVSGVSRLGLAGNDLDEEGMEHVMHYFRSGMCQGLDIGGNDLHGKLGMIAEAVTPNSNVPCWGLSLAGCNLTAEDLKDLFPALVRLPDFRFIDLSHNPDLCLRSNDAISLFRRYMSKFTMLKRIHLVDVGMSPKQAIALADCLPDGPRLAHLNILENSQLSALAHASDEAMQEEACALYASLMAAVRVSSTLICIDIDVPSKENSEVVKALAKQVVAYSLRNMEQFAIAEATGSSLSPSDAAAAAKTQLTKPHGGEKQIKEITVPDVLMHLVGHVEGNSENHDKDDSAPDDDYIVGGTGVVKALQYVLGEKANDLRRSSVPGTPISGAMTPREGRPGSSAGLPPTDEQRVKAKKMSTNLLGSARKIRSRLQPALAKEAQTGDELAYRRLMFLDHTLQNMIERFEQEYPETKPPPTPETSSVNTANNSTTGSAEEPRTNTTSKTDLSVQTPLRDPASDDEDLALKAAPLRRHGSEVSLASRAQIAEEGRLHRLGQHLRREVIDSPTTVTPATTTHTISPATNKAEEDERLRALGEKIERLSGVEIKGMMRRDGAGWEGVLREAGANYEDLRRLQELDPEAWEQFRESQEKARMNVGRGRG